MTTSDSNQVVREKMVGEAPATPDDAGEKKAPPRRIKTTMGELGPSLPVGYLVGGALVKDLKDRVWRTKDERELAKMRKKNQSMASYLTMVVGQMFSKFGPHSFAIDQKPAEKQVAIGQAYMGDVFYAYMYLRSQVIGNELKMDITCPTPDCGSFKFIGDLSSTVVHRVDEPEALIWWHELEHPIELRGKEIKKFRLTTPLWHSLVSSSKDDNFNEALARIMLVQSSISGLNDEPGLIALADSEMDELGKRDLETIARKANDEFIGPKMGVEGKCPKCEREFNAPIDWSYDNFFTTSSL
jgi:hypothetical protein